jgi:hypothetical protein
MVLIVVIEIRIGVMKAQNAIGLLLLFLAMIMRMIVQFFVLLKIVKLIQVVIGTVNLVHNMLPLNVVIILRQYLVIEILLVFGFFLIVRVLENL